MSGLQARMYSETEDDTGNRGAAMNKPAAQYSSQQFNVEALRQENQQFSATTGSSANNRGLGFVPAFMDTETGNVYLSRFCQWHARPNPCTGRSAG